MHPNLHEIPLASIDVGNDRARDLDPAWAEALSVLIAEQDQLQPILVRPLGDGRYRLVAGLHRMEGVRLLGRETIPAVLSLATLDLHRFCSGQVLMLGGPLFEGHG